MLSKLLPYYLREKSLVFGNMIYGDILLMKSALKTDTLVLIIRMLSVKRGVPVYSTLLL